MMFLVINFKRKKRKAIPLQKNELVKKIGDSVVVGSIDKSPQEDLDVREKSWSSSHIRIRIDWN